MSLSRRDFLKYAGSTGAGVAVGHRGARPQAGRSGRHLAQAQGSEGPSRASVPYCAVGCIQLVYSKGDKIIDIEGHPGHARTRWAASAPRARRPSSSPTTRCGRPRRCTARPARTSGRRSRSTGCTTQIAKRYYDTREKYFIEKEKDKDGQEVVVNRLDAIASLGSACIDNEECYLLTKLNRTFGIVYHEHQARV